MSLLLKLLSVSILFLFVLLILFLSFISLLPLSKISLLIFVFIFVLLVLILLLLIELIVLSSFSFLFIFVFSILSASSFTIYLISTKLLPKVNNSSFSFPTTYFLIFNVVRFKFCNPSWHVKKKEINNSSLLISTLLLYKKYI
jgi:hypothetical protein